MSEAPGNDQPPYAPPEARRTDAWTPSPFAIAPPELRHSSTAGLATFAKSLTTEGAEGD